MLPFEDDAVAYFGPFLTSRGRYFYRDVHETLWEIIPTDDRTIPFNMVKVAEIVSPEEARTAVLKFVKNHTWT